MTDKNRFLNDVRHHKMTIELEAGLHRSVYFQRNGTFNRRFRIVTWPGYLCISGDCEDYTFARLPDMFEFFRGTQINPSYWAEKLQSPMRNEICRAFSEERFTAAIRDDFEQWTFSDDAQKQRALEHLTDDWDGLIGAPPQDERAAMDAAMRYVCPETKQVFQEFYEHCIWDYSYHFTWACRAIQWGIKRYDMAKDGRMQSDHDRLVLEGAL